MPQNNLFFQPATMSTPREKINTQESEINEEIITKRVTRQQINLEEKMEKQTEFQEKVTKSTHSLKASSANAKRLNRSVDFSNINLDDHPAYRMYKEAGEYWNKYPKTDYTYSRLSSYRKELKPGIVQMPNLSRRPLHDQSYCHSCHLAEQAKLSTSQNENSSPIYCPIHKKENSFQLFKRFISRSEYNNGYDANNSFVHSRDMSQEETNLIKILRITRLLTVYSYMLSFFSNITNNSFSSSTPMKKTRSSIGSQFYQQHTKFGRAINTVASIFTYLGAIFFLYLAKVFLWNARVLSGASKPKTKLRNILLITIVPFVLLLGVYYCDYLNNSVQYLTASLPTFPKPTFPTEFPKLSLTIFNDIYDGLMNAFIYIYESVLNATNATLNQIQFITNYCFEAIRYLFVFVYVEVVNVSMYVFDGIRVGFSYIFNAIQNALIYVYETIFNSGNFIVNLISGSSKYTWTSVLNFSRNVFKHFVELNNSIFDGFINGFVYVYESIVNGTVYIYESFIYVLICIYETMLFTLNYIYVGILFVLNYVYGLILSSSKAVWDFFDFDYLKIVYNNIYDKIVY